jgi:tetratricopeptide (TPR) repeat protein
MTMKTSSLLLALMVACGSPAFAQDDLQRAKDLYAAAAYEEALAVLTAVPDAERVPQIDQYRAFCLIALGQGEEAQAAIEDVLAADPLYQPDPAETSPRVLEAFVAARERALPVITKQMYTEAKAALERKEREAAVTGFQRLLRAIDSAPDLKATFEDLRVLADGFLTLSRALPESSSAPAPAAPSAPAAPAAAESSPLVASATRPVVVKQDMPPWLPYDGASRRQAFSGLLRIRVGADGRVQSAEMVQPVHPAYDQQLLRSAESWVYQPATENGIPVAADVMVQIQLRPPEP